MRNTSFKEKTSVVASDKGVCAGSVTYAEDDVCKSICRNDPRSANVAKTHFRDDLPLVFTAV